MTLFKNTRVSFGSPFQSRVRRSTSLRFTPPEVIESFRKLAATGCVEFLAETYSHSLSALKNKTEFKRQVETHATAIETLLGKKPAVFANTELIYSDEIGATVAEMGYKATITK